MDSVIKSFIKECAGKDSKKVLKKELMPFFDKVKVKLLNNKNSDLEGLIKKAFRTFPFEKITFKSFKGSIYEVYFSINSKNNFVLFLTKGLKSNKIYSHLIQIDYDINPRLIDLRIKSHFRTFHDFLKRN